MSLNKYLKTYSFDGSVMLWQNKFSFSGNRNGATSGGGTAYPSGAPELTPVFGGIRAA